jgi:cysteine desulfuration protein SufE
MTLEEKQNEFVELFNLLGSWQERFQYLIEIGYELPDMPEHLKTKETLIYPCHSRTYFHVSVWEGIIYIQGWSNATIPSGMIMMLKNIFEGVSLEELRDTDINFHIKTNLIHNITGQRRAALYEMINRILRT